MSCNGNVYNIGMGCCELVLGPVENYYTKPTIDRKLEEITSAITSGCCITPEEVDEKIEEAISGITVSGVTEEQMNEAIESAKTEIEAEIPSLDGYASEQWVLDQHYISGVDLSDYALKSEIPTVPTSNTAFTNDAGYLTEHQSLSGYATTAFVSAFTYDKATIDEKVAQGGSFDPSQYYNKTATDALLDEKLDVTAYTPTDLSNYYTKTEVDNEIISAITDVEAEIPTVPTSNTAFTNDAGYLTEHQSLSGYATEQWVEDKHYITGVDLSNYATKAEIPVVPTSNTAFTNDAGYLTEHQSLTAYSTTQEMNTAISQAVSGKQDTLSAGTNITIVDNVISAQGGGATYTAGTGIDITSDVISTTLPISSGSGQYSIVVSALDNQYKPTASGSYSYAEGANTSAKGTYSHAEGDFTTATGSSAHAEGHNTKAYGTYSHAEGYNTQAIGTYSHAEGNTTQAIGQNSHVEGYNATASTDYSHAEGAYTKANASYSHVEGAGSQTNASYSHAEGYFTKTENSSEHASGQYNVSNKASATFGDSGNTLFSVGNGTGSNTRHNAFEVRQNGDIYIQSGNTDIKLQDHLDGVTYTAGTGIDITNNVISAVIKFWCGTMSEYEQISQPDNNTIYLIHS